jgi:hypothetical protein
MRGGGGRSTYQVKKVNHGLFAEYCGDCMAVATFVGDILGVWASLVALAVGFVVCKDRVEVVGGEEIAVVSGETNCCGLSCLESESGSGWLGSRLLSSVWSTLVCARLHLSTGGPSSEGPSSLALPKGRLGSCFGLVCIHRQMIIEAKITMSTANTPPTIGAIVRALASRVLGDLDIEDDFKATVVGGRGHVSVFVVWSLFRRS